MSAPTRRARGSYAKSVERRRAIVAAAVEVFATSGFRNGSLRDVADRVGLTHAGVMHHFPTKVDLLRAVLAWRDEEALARARATAPSGIDVLRAWLDELVRNEETPVLVDLALTLTTEGTSSEHPVHQYTLERYALVLDFLTRAFGVIQDRGQLRPGLSPAHEARSLLALTEGLQLQWLLDPGSVNVVAHVRDHLQDRLTVDL